MSTSVLPAPVALNVHVYSEPTENRSIARVFDVHEALAYVCAMATTAVLTLVHLVVIDAWGRAEHEKVRDVLMQWDAARFTSIADHGYTQADTVAFFPGYPTLVRIVAAPLHIFAVDDATLIASLALSQAASLIAACGLTRLALTLYRRRRPGPVGTGTRAALGIAAAVLTFGAPMAVVYGMPYSEALYLALTVWAINMMVEQHYLVAALLVMAAGVTRLTAPALIATLAACTVVEVWRYVRDRRAWLPVRFPWAAVTAPLVGSIGIVGYLTWANNRTTEDGGYFAVQDDGWGSRFDWGASTWRWLRGHSVSVFGDATSAGYAVSSWAMIVVLALCAASLWPLLRGRLLWQAWLPAVLIAAIVLGSGGIMHSRPRLLMVPVLLLLLPAVVHAVGRVAARSGWQRYFTALLLATAGVAWCAIGIRISGYMLIPFDYGI